LIVGASVGLVVGQVVVGLIVDGSAVGAIVVG